MRDHKHHIAAVLNSLGRLAQAQGNQQEAVTHFRASLLLYKEMVDKQGAAATLEGMAASVIQDELAIRLYGAAHALRQVIGAPLPPVERDEYEQRISALRVQLGEQLFESLWMEGGALSYEQAISHALSASEIAIA
jgi:hypothetical protein